MLRGVLSGQPLLTIELTHGLHQLEDAGIINTVVNEVGVLPVADDPLVAQNGKVLGDIGVGGLNLFPDIPDRHLLVLKKAKDLEPNGMRHGFQHAGNGFNLVVFHSDTLSI